jgi:pSer/pThr/pTyr-binding forkhead associated (FHA) protein/tetratricopeptide (TPR) repeat protein
MFKLVIQDDEGKTTVVPLIRDEITVGRKEGNTIRLTERNVSRHHARIVRANGSIAIEDLDSYNGVRVNGSRIKGRQPLTLSDRIQIGDYLLELKADTAEASSSGADDQLTQPIEKPERASSSSSSIPVMQAAGLPNAETVKLPNALTASASTNTNTNRAEHGGNGGNGVSAAAAVTPAPVLERKLTPAVPEQPADDAGQARLTVLSSNFAGVEFELTEPTMVLGRTDDNDIVINHRSISRNHAKIVREDGRYTIVDLQSSNGVRVNNEEYDKVELRRGDLIDLGHVRLRFADPGDDYAFKLEDVSDVSTSSSKGVWYALLAVLVVLVGVGVFALLSDGTQPDGDTTQDPPDDKVSGVQKDPVTQTPKSDFDGLMVQAEAALAKRDWQVATDKGREALALAPSDAAAQQRAQQVIDRATSESAFKLRHDALLDAVAKKEWAKVKAELAAIDKKSAYHPEAQAAHDKARDSYLAEREAEAEELFDQRKCPGIRKLQNDANALWPESAQRLGELAEACRKAGVAQQQQQRPPPTPPPPPPDEPDEPDEPRSDKSVTELVAEAQDAAFKGQYGRARKLCEQALEVQPREPRAVSICATAACGLGNARLAKRYYDQAVGPERRMIQQLCSGKGIELGPGSP